MTTPRWWIVALTYKEFITFCRVSAISTHRCKYVNYRDTPWALKGLDLDRVRFI